MVGAEFGDGVPRAESAELCFLKPNKHLEGSIWNDSGLSARKDSALLANRSSLSWGARRASIKAVQLQLSAMTTPLVEE